jgi:hypothetical protein
MLRSDRKEQLKKPDMFQQELEQVVNIAKTVIHGQETSDNNYYSPSDPCFSRTIENFLGINRASAKNPIGEKKT